MSDIQKLKVRIIGAFDEPYLCDADMVVMPGRDGELGAMPFHVPMIVELKGGSVRIYNGSDITPIHISGGIARIDALTIDILHSGESQDAS